MAKIIHSSTLFTHPSTLKGSGRLADLFGQLDEYNFTDEKQDTKALARDWKVTGFDLLSAIALYGTKKTLKKKK